MKVRYDPSRGLVVGSAYLVGPSGITATVSSVALDTEALKIVLSKEILQKVGCKFTPDLPSTRVVTGTGVTRCPIVSINRLEAFGCQRTNLEVMALDLPEEARLSGLIGLDFLRGTVLTIDFIKSEVEVFIPPEGGRERKQ